MSEYNHNVLIVDDDRDFIDDFRKLLPKDIKCNSVSSAEEACNYLDSKEANVVFLDIDLGSGNDGLELLQKLKQEWPYLPVIMITADQRVDTIVKAMNLGASDYIGKSPDLNKLRISIDRAISENHLHKRIELLESELNNIIGDLVGKSEAIMSIKNEIARLAQVQSNVLITGQSGTGKELVARGIHRLSTNRNRAFIAVNCAALSRELFESELFGHEKGAFTGAISKRVGKFELVGSGTLFLDEITEIPAELQAKLLRVLQEREFERVGGNRLIPFNGRLLASSNRDLEQTIKDKCLRQDLYYRLNVTHIHIPPLQERKEDIPILINHFIRIKSQEMKKRARRIDNQAMQLLYSYNWPGNVRELINRIENAVVHCDGECIEQSHFSGMMIAGKETFTNYEEAKKHFLTQFQREYISVLLQKNKGNKTKTAQEMGITRQGLSNIMDACGLS